MIKVVKRALIVFRNVITLRRLRKFIYAYIKKIKYRKIAQQIELSFSKPAVFIFQHQFFDCSAKHCFNGGAERYVCDLADILTDMGYIPCLIQMGNKKGHFWQKNVDNLEIIGISVKNIEDYTAFLQGFRRYEFVIYSGYTDWGTKIHPNILISHGVTWDTQDKDVHSQRILKVIQDVDNFVSVDVNTISWLRTTFSKTLSKKRMNYIPNYVDTKKYVPLKRKNDGKIHLLFPRRASAERGYWLVSTALPYILKKYQNIVFDFVGFAHTDAIRRDIKKLSGQFLGRVNHYVVKPNEMIGIYQKTDIAIIPTLYSEGTSLSCLEAQACGNIVISTNIGGLANLILDGYNGFLINPDIYDLTDALDRALSNPLLCEKISLNAIEVAKAFDKTIWISKWESIIKSI
ncbi:MAG: glycosyltransferase family 4 protein [Campylobacteraceae bacterium]|jgi:glycosyltransferase involved in cell wall biosynthesis|nr:glycosyltransferase family 4 protein [Campylobacteraceae bacterium]